LSWVTHSTVLCGIGIGVTPGWVAAAPMLAAALVGPEGSDDAVVPSPPNHREEVSDPMTTATTSAALRRA
jgi:hypothetical protein